MKIDPNAPAMPCAVSYSGYEVVVAQTDHGLWQAHGLSIRAELATRMTDDFLLLDAHLRTIIAGEPPMTKGDDDGWSYPHLNEEVIEYAEWLAVGRAKWRLMQADVLINALNEEK